METKNLPNEIKVLKKDLVEKIQAFNKKTGLSIDGAVVEANYAQESINGERVLLSYEVGINIQL